MNTQRKTEYLTTYFFTHRFHQIGEPPLGLHLLAHLPLELEGGAGGAPPNPHAAVNVVHLAVGELFVQTLFRNFHAVGGGELFFQSDSEKNRKKNSIFF